MGNTRVDGFRLTCGSLAKTSELIRSLRDDEQVKSQEPRSANGCALMTRVSGRSFLKADVPAVVRLMGPFVVPIDEK